MTIGEICNRETVIVTEDEGVLDAARRMREYHVGDLVVVRDEDGRRRPVGVVTDRDLVVSVLAKDVDHLGRLLVSDILTGTVVTAREDERVHDALRRMRAHHVRRMPVVDREGNLVGIFSVDDMLELMASELADVSRLVTEQPTVEERVRGR